MKIKKVLSLLLSVISLNFTNCFGMVSDDYSITEVTIPGRTNCPICHADRSSIRSATTGSYTSPCHGCYSKALASGNTKSGKKYTIRKPANSDLSCRYCGCRRIFRNGLHDNKQIYQCANCRKNGFEKSMLQETNNQIWKKDFCKDCNRLDGFVFGKLISGNKDIHTNKRVKKANRVKCILSNPHGFDYYCYSCKKLKHIILNTEKAKHVCAEYDKHLLN